MHRTAAAEKRRIRFFMRKTSRLVCCGKERGFAFSYMIGEASPVVNAD